MTRKTLCILCAAAALFAASCSAPTKISYFQDVQSGEVEEISAPSAITIRPADMISIVVKSRDIDLSNLFNLPYVSQMVGGASEAYSNGRVLGYTVDDSGEIDFPVLGKIKVAGMTRSQIEAHIKELLISQNQVKDPVVTVEYMNLQVSVFGEVTRPGRFSITKDAFTILDALAAAGDLTIYGLRDNIKVFRTSNGKKHTYVLNLCSAKEMVSSPAYYLQQNDVIYVEPNDVRARQSTVNGNNVLSTSFWISIASLAATIVTTVVSVSAIARR